MLRLTCGIMSPMDMNPYMSPAAPLKPARRQNWLLWSIDVCAICAATLPFLYVAGLIAFSDELMLDSKDPPVVFLMALFASCCSAALMSALYNLVRVIRGSRIAICGLLVNAASFPAIVVCLL